MKNIVALSLIFIFISCKKEVKPESNNTVEKPTEITVEVINYEGLEALLSKDNGKTYIVNFWATWCKPCIEELPSFEKIYKNYKNKNVELILVSLDFTKQIDKRVIPFIKKNNLQGKVVVMGDPDQNTWIPKVDENWSGAIPATVIYTKNSREFYEQSFTYEALEFELKKHLKTN